MVDPSCIKKGHRWGYSSEGFILPCCWIWSARYDLVPELMQDKFNLSNVNSIDEILNSLEWQNFLNNMRNTYQTSPWDLCKRHCPKKNV